MPSAYHMVHYRKFEVDGGSVDGAKFETLCRDALGKKDANGLALWERAQHRVYDVGDDAGGKILLNKAADLEDAVFGEMCFVESKGLQALLEMKATKLQTSNLTLAEVFGLGESAAPSGSQFVRGLAYWLAIGDHIFFVKTQAMTPDRIHAYFHWLLKGATAVIQPNVTFSLQAELDAAATHVADVGEIVRLKVSGKSAPRSLSPAAEEGDASPRSKGTRKKIADLSFISERAKPIAEAVFGKARTDSLVSALGPDEYLAVDASVAVRGRRTEASKKAMKALVNDVANESDAKVQVEGKDGKVSDGDAILRTRMPFNIPHDASSLLDFDNVADQLQEVYARFVKDKKIKA